MPIGSRILVARIIDLCLEGIMPSGVRLSTGLGALLGLVFCDHSPVTMRVGAGLPRTEFGFLSGSGSY
jgi:hypothetical protein